MKRSTIILGLLLICASVFSNTNITKKAFLKSYKHSKSISLPLMTAPSVVADQVFTIAENPTTGDVIGIIDTTTAGGLNGTATWALSNNPDPNGNGNLAFEISPSGELKVLDAEDFDYETSTSLSVTVTVSDDDGAGTPNPVTVNITAVNDNTPVVTTTTLNVNENSIDETVIGTLTATDDDDGTSFSGWTITAGNTSPDTDGNLAFRLNESTGVLTINDSGDFDYETTNSFTLTVTVSDGLHTSAPFDITINVNNQNDIKPVISAASFSVDEDAADDYEVGTLIATDGDDADGSTTTFQSWTITEGNTNTDGDGQNPFEIDATGKITVNDAGDIDYETTPSYTLKVTVSDGVNTSDPVDITVTINNKNDIAPVITPASFSVSENATNDTEVGILQATDGDGTTTYQNWTLLDEGNTDANIDGKKPFGIDASTGKIIVTDENDIDFETTNTYTLKVTVSDGANTSSETNITINVGDSNDSAPVIETGRIIYINENTANNNNVGQITATDTDSGTTFQNWTITSNYDGDDADTDPAFKIDASTGMISVNDVDDLDYEKVTSIELKLTVSDGTNTSAEETVTINLNNLNDNIPVITAAQTFTIAENTAISNIVGEVLATDGDAGTTNFQNWTLTQNPNADDDATLAFYIDPDTGVITVLDAGDLDYEKTKTLTISVTVRDGENTSSPVPIIINLTDENDNTPVIDAGQSFSIPEDIADEGVVGTVTATDADEATTFQEWELLAEGNDSSDEDLEKPFKIDPNTGQISINDAGDIDFEKTPIYTLKAIVSDGTNTSTAVNITVNISDQNDAAPVITAGQILNVNENSGTNTSVGTIDAKDADAGTILQNWTIVTNTNPNGLGENAFSINASSGEITVNDKDDLDYETNKSLTIEVSVSDGVNTSDTVAVTINLNDMNDVAPVITAGQTLNIDENSTQGNSVGTVEATDEDTGTTVLKNWIISKNIDPNGNSVNAFSINAETGLISVNDVGDFDRERNDSLVIELTVNDEVNNISASTPVVIYINDMNDIKPVITANQSFDLDETAPLNTVVGKILVTDGDVTETTFSNWNITNIVNPDGNGTLAFIINTDGELIVADTNDINYELNQSLSVDIAVSDGVNISDTVSVTVNITNINDMTPVITAGQALSVNENSPDGTAIGIIAATDGDSGTVFQNWTITNNVRSDGATKDAYAINVSTGELSIADSIQFNYETNTSDTIWVTVSDGVHTSLETEVIINITDANDLTPVITEGQILTIDENTANNTAIGTLVATDADAAPTTFQNWTIRVNTDSDADGIGAFSINASTGDISINDVDDIDFEKAQTHTIKVTVSDGVNTSDTTDVVININDLNDVTPVITADQIFTIDENLAKDALVGIIVATDGDITVTALRDWSTSTNIDPNGNDTTAFVIDSISGEIRVNDPGDLNFENDTIFTLSVTVSDSVNTSIATDIVIKLNDVNDVVPVITANQVFTINENLAKDSLVGTVVATDGDITPTTFQNWTIVENVNPNANGDPAFVINKDNGNITVLDSLDLNYEQDTTFTIKVTVSDGVNTSDTMDIVINLLDLNDILPVVTPDQIFDIDENTIKGTVVDTVVATDADATATIFSKWTISTNIDPNGNDTLAFAIDTTTGILTINDQGDFDRESNEKLEIYVTVFDGNNTSLPEKVTINVNDLNDVVPVVAADQNFTIPENTVNGTLLGNLIATDGDVTPTTFNKWTISTISDADNDGNGAFALDTLTGALTINDVDDIDYEKNMDITIEVTVSDSVNISAPRQVIIHLTDLNDVLPEVTKGQNFIVSEDVDNAVSVGIVEATDGDITPTIFSQWAITTNVDPDNDGIPTFGINPSNGEIFVNDADEIDFEKDSKFYIAVTVFDGVNTGIPRVVTIYIDNLEDEVPVITPGQVFYLNEDAVRRTVVGVVEATDKDAGMVVLQNWTILNNPDGDGDGRPAFKIDDETGEISVNDTDDIDYELSNKHSLEITVSDGTNVSEVETVVININRILGIADEAMIEFNIYPNPVVDYATLTTKVQGTLYIINDRGQQLRQMKITDYSTPISVQDLNNGIYYFVFKTPKTKISKKIIVNNR